LRKKTKQEQLLFFKATTFEIKQNPKIPRSKIEKDRRQIQDKSLLFLKKSFVGEE